MAEQSLKNKTVKGVAWSGIDNVAQMGVTFVVGVILARILTPDDYGLLGIIMIFSSICTSLMNAGFTTALIRKPDANEDDYNTSFIVNVGLSILFYTLIYVCSPLIAEFFRREELIDLTRVTSLGIVIGALSIHIIFPLNSMSHGASSFAFTSTEERDESVERIKSLQIRTGDEIENLYSAYAHTTEESMRYLTESRRKTQQINKLQGGLLMVLADVIESRDKCTGDHIRKTAEYSRVILEKLKEQGEFPDILTDEYINNVVSAAPLHDIGKINIPDAILNKDSRLTDEEYEIMKGHANAGYEIIEKAIANLTESGYLEQAKQMAHYHHEKWDGSGYPEHLKEGDIPLSARVMAVADVFDALLSRRSYKEPFSFEKAMSIIKEGSGKHFDPKVVSAFEAASEEIKKISERFAD